MLLSIKFIAALSIVPLSFAQDCLDKAEQGDFCNLGEFNRLEPISGVLTEFQLLDIVPTNPPCAPNCCPIIAGQVGIPVCHGIPLVPIPPEAIVVARNNHCPNISVANVLSVDKNVFRCVAYYHFPGAAPFNCNLGYTPLCRYCALQDYTPELSRNFVYTPNNLVGALPGTLLAIPTLPFRCGAPKCPEFAPVPGSTKYVRLSAAYCVSNGGDTSAVTTPYAGVWQNYACGAGLNQEVVNQKWGCYIGTDITTLFPGSTDGTWCDPGFTPTCYYDVSKPYSYPPFFTD